MHMDIYVIYFTDYKSEVRSDLRGCLEAAVASEAKKSPPAISLTIRRRSIRSIPCSHTTTRCGGHSRTYVARLLF